MEFTEIGKITFNFWNEIPNHFPFVTIDEFIIMPEHNHEILIFYGGITNGGVDVVDVVETQNFASLQHPSQSIQNPSQSIQNPSQRLQRPSQSIQNPSQTLQHPSQTLQQPPQPIQPPPNNYKSYNQKAKYGAPPIRPDMNIILNEFCIMPDHFNWIIIFGGIGDGNGLPVGNNCRVAWGWL